MAELAVVLAAGGSRRMGQPKALLDWGGQPLVRAHVEALRAVVVDVLVVEGAVPLGEAVGPATLCANPDWAHTWPADSLRVALARRPAAASALVTPVDVPPARAETLAALIGAGSAVPVDPQGRDGHPVLLRGAELAAVRRASPEGGLRALLSSARRVRVSDPLLAVDFDDPEAFATCRRAVLGEGASLSPDPR